MLTTGNVNFDPLSSLKNVQVEGRGFPFVSDVKSLDSKLLVTLSKLTVHDVHSEEKISYPVGLEQGWVIHGRSPVNGPVTEKPGN